jgi:predicted SAM-dependent methyltransferase
MPSCIICNNSIQAWKPHPEIARRSEFCKLIKAVGSDLSVYQCPACGCNDRDRHLWHYLTAIGVIEKIPNFRILHIAPEVHIEQLIEKNQPQCYIRGDLHPKKLGHIKLNVESLPYEDNTFDLIICNHVLEHVSFPSVAVSEFHRCLCPSGLLVAQTPYSPMLKNTLELTQKPSLAFAKMFFGQEDHVRMFGSDISEIFTDAGFKGEILDHSIVLGEINAAEAGVNASEGFFAFTK